MIVLYIDSTPLVGGTTDGVTATEKELETMVDIAGDEEECKRTVVDALMLLMIGWWCTDC